MADDLGEVVLEGLALLAASAPDIILREIGADSPVAHALDQPGRVEGLAGQRDIEPDGRLRLDEQCEVLLVHRGQNRCRARRLNLGGIRGEVAGFAELDEIRPDNLRSGLLDRLALALLSVAAE